MNPRDLNHLLKYPDALQSADASALEELVREYPYFQTAYLLLAKRAKLKDDPSFNKSLNLAAIYATDRTKLYELINRPVVQELSPAKNGRETKIDTKDSTNEEEQNGLLQSIPDKKKQFLSTEEKRESSALQNDEAHRILMEELKSSGSEFAPITMDLTENAADDQETFTADSEMIQRLEQEAGEQEQYLLYEDFLLLNETGGGGSEYLPLNDALSEESVNSFVEEYDAEMQSNVVIEEEFIFRDLDSELKEKKVVDPSSEHPLLLNERLAADQFQPDPELESKTFDHESEFQNEWGNNSADLSLQDTLSELPPENEASLKVDSASTHTDFRINEKVDTPGKFLPGKSYSFIEWLQFFKPESQDKKESKIPQSDSETLEPEKESPEINPEAVTSGLSAELETIDKIISTLQSEDKVKPELHLAPADLAQKSLELDDEIASETLAEIYENQGLYNKAIRMYVRLSLKFPEKSLFFAARIKELKSKK
jgi:hypothetical protein